jgi:uncharacterized protein (DUF58 family)
MAATLGFAVVRQSDKVSLTTFDTRIRGFVPPSNSMSQAARMTHHLDEIEPVEKTDLAGCLFQLAGRTGRREIVMVFSDFFGDLDSLEDALHRLRYQNHEVVLFHVLHRHELTFEFEAMTKFVGLEAAEELLAQPEDLRRGYLEALNRFHEQFEEIAARNRCERVLVDTSQPMHQVLIDYLNRRSLLNRGR